MPGRLRRWSIRMVLLAIGIGVVGWGLLQRHGPSAGLSAPRSTAVAESWSFGWEGIPSADETLTSAFATHAYTMSPSKARLSPAHVSWLAQSPSFALALVQLDPTNMHEALAYFTNTDGWVLAGAIGVGRVPINPSVEASAPIALPPDHYNGASFSQMFAPQFTMRLWISSTREFIFSYLPDEIPAALMPKQTIQIGPYQGWLSHQDSLSTIIIPLRRHTLVFSGNVDESQAKLLAKQCLQQLGELT